MCVCVCVCVCVCMHHMSIIVNLTFIQGHTDLDHENNKCSTIAETFEAIRIKFAVKIVRLKDYDIIFCKSSDLALHSRSQRRLKLDKCLTYTIIAISRILFKL